MVALTSLRLTTKHKMNDTVLKPRLKVKVTFTAASKRFLDLLQTYNVQHLSLH